MAGPYYMTGGAWRPVAECGVGPSHSWVLGPKHQPRRLQQPLAGSFERERGVSGAAEQALQTAMRLFDAHIAVADARPIADLLPLKCRDACAAQADGGWALLSLVSFAAQLVQLNFCSSTFVSLADNEITRYG